MTRRLFLWDEAEEELYGAAQWYETNRHGLGHELLEAVENVFRAIREHPQHHQVVKDDVRRALTDRFPYSIYFRVREGTVEVLAIMHQARHPSRWQRRIRRPEKSIRSVAP